MKKRIIPITLIAMCLLSSCSQTPDNIQGNNHNVDLNSENNKVSVEHILDDFDEAFETEYSKFKLPDKSSVIINQPEEVCNLELKYVNADKNTKWMKKKITELANFFDIPNNIKIENVNNQNSRFTIETSNKAVDIILFSNPYFILKNNYNLNDMVNTTIEYIDRIELNELNSIYQDLIKKSIKLSESINNIMESKLDISAADLYIKNYNGETFYELDLQQNYKGMGIQCISPNYLKESNDVNNDILAQAMYTSMWYNSNLNLFLYNGCDSYVPIEINHINKIISFKGACDILESQLAENMTLEFDDMKLWYEPRGSFIDLSDPSISTYEAHDGNKTIKCTPKWFFISDNDEDSNLHHAINYVTVDCVTGEIEVFFPG